MRDVKGRKGTVTLFAFSLAFVVVTLVVLFYAFMYLPTASCVRIAFAHDGRVRMTWRSDHPVADHFHVAADGRNYHARRHSSGVYMSAPIDVRDRREVTLELFVHTGLARSFAFDAPAYPYRIAVVGDLGASAESEAVLRRVADIGADMLLIPGDVAYPGFFPTLGWTALEHMIERTIPPGTPVMVASGNHDHTDLLRARFPMPWAHPVYPYYTFTVLGAFFLVMSYNQHMGATEMRATLDYAEARLALINRTEFQTVVLVDHFPHRTSARGWHNVRNDPHGAYYMTEMDSLRARYHVNLMVHGHVHATELFQDPHSHTAALVAGGATQPLHTKWVDAPRDRLFHDDKRALIPILTLIGPSVFSIGFVGLNGAYLGEYIF